MAVIDASEARQRFYRRAVIISLFSWRRAEPGDQPDDSDPKGYWGDSYPSVANDLTGSRLYLLKRRTITAQTMRDAVAFAEESLAWFVADGHAGEVVVTVERRGVDGLSMRVVIDLLDDDPLELEFDDFWRVLNAV